ncbi:MAG: hypothetical protein MPI95_06055 [Nitrosopumilus sp.]|nr:hypothetical protein [Nitrosopumilus sp.]
MAPRLRYSGVLLDSVVGSLRSASSVPGPDAERGAVSAALETALVVRGAAGRVTGVDGIVSELPAPVQAARTASARLHSVMPGCSRALSEASACLGSVVFDSASITRARLDFGRSGREAERIMRRASGLACAAPAGQSWWR